MAFNSKRSKRLYKKSIKQSINIQAQVNDDLVSSYLIEHPDYFIRHAKQIEQMNIPHPVRGVISLSEWQLARQRNKIKELESEISILMDHASQNEQLFESLMSLQNQLLLAIDLNDMVLRLNKWAKSLGLAGAYLHLFDNKWQLNAPSNYYHFALSVNKFDFIRIRHLQHSNQYLGQLNNTELALLIPDKTYVGSVALSLLGKFGDLGVLVFASRNPNHYQFGQGTLLLDNISEILPILVNHWVTRKN